MNGTMIQIDSTTLTTEDHSGMDVFDDLMEEVITVSHVNHDGNYDTIYGTDGRSHTFLPGTPLYLIVLD